MRLGLGLKLGGNGGVGIPQIITATIRPAVSALQEGQSLSDIPDYATMIAQANFDSSAGNVTAPVVTFQGVADATTPLTAGQIVSFTVTVGDDAGTPPRPFATAALTVSGAARVVSATAGVLDGATLPVILDVADGTPDVFVAVGDFALVGDGSTLLNRNLAVGGENIIDRPIATAGDWIPGGGGVVSTDLTLNALGLFPGVDFQSAGAVWNRLQTTGNVEHTTDPEVPPVQYVVAFVYGVSDSGRVRLVLRNNPASTETSLRGPLGDVAVTGGGTAGDVSIIAQEDNGVEYVCWVLYTPNFTGQCSFGIGPDQANSKINIFGINAGQGTEPISFIAQNAPASRPDAVVSGTFLNAVDGSVDLTLPNGLSSNLSALATSPGNTVVVSDGPFPVNTSTPVAATPPSLPIIIHEADQSRFRVVDQGAMTNTDTLRYEWFIDGVLVSGSPELTAPDAGANAGDVVRLDLYYVNANGESLQQSNELIFGGRDFSDIHQVVTAINAATITGGLAVGGDSTRFRETTRMMQHYYPTQLAKIHPTGMALVNNAWGGQSAQDWANDVDNSNIGQLDGQIPGTGAGWIYELSLGINDYTADTPAVKAAMKAGLELGLNRLHSLYPDMLIYLVTPVFNENPARNAMTQEVYAELSAERTLPLIDAFTPMQDVWDAATDFVFYEDGTHPSSQGSARLIHVIFNEIVPPSLYSTVTIDNMHRNPGTGVPAEPLTQAEIIAGLTLNLALVNANPVVAANNPPVAVDDSGFTTPFETVGSFDLVANDTDADSDTLTLQSVAIDAPSEGTVAVVGGNLQLTPATGFDGVVTGTYVVTDGTDTDSGTWSVTVEAEVVIPEINSFAVNNVSPPDVTFDINTSVACEVDWVMTASATAPTPAQVAAGTDNSDVAATASGTLTVASNGLVTSTGAIPADLDATYAFHANAHDGSGNRSTDVDSVTGVAIDTTSAPATTPVTVTPIGAAPTLLDASASPMTGDFTRTETGAGLIVIAGLNFRGSATEAMSAVSYDGDAMSFDVEYGTDTDSYVAIASLATMATGTNQLAVTFGTQAAFNNHGAQLFELPDGGTVGTPVTDEIAGPGTLSVDLAALPAGAGVIVVAYGQNMTGDFVFTGATETADLVLGSNRMSAAYVSNLGSATDPLTITAVNSAADSTDIGLLMAIPILPA